MEMQKARPSYTIVGVVGYSPVVEAFPLGPRLMATLERACAAHDTVVIENMSWGPIHVVQRFQDDGVRHPDRLILVGASSFCREPGRVRAFRWGGGTLSDDAMQQRIYEAVTGVVDLENTLIIGSHFGVWPAETFTVEIDLLPETFGTMVIAETEGRTADDDVRSQLGFRPEDAIETLGHFVLDLVQSGTEATCAPAIKSADGLTARAQMIQTEFVGAPAEGSIKTHVCSR